MEGFEVKPQNKEFVTTLYLKGYLDAHTAPSFEEALQHQIDQGRYRIIVNFKELNYISSAGLGVFMGFIEDVRNNQGDIKLSNLNPKVYRVFDLLGFPMILDIYDNEDEAISRFSDSGN